MKTRDEWRRGNRFIGRRSFKVVRSSLQAPLHTVLISVAVVISACAEEQAEPPSTTSTSTTSTSTTTSTTTTTTVPETPADIESVALLPDETTLQDGVWAAILFRQPLECIPGETDLTAAGPAECEASVLFEGERPGELIGDEVPVWLVRWPVISYALNNGITMLEEIRRLPTVIETVSEDYNETEGEIRVRGPIPDMGDYRIDVVGEETMLRTPFSVGEEISLSTLTGDWDTGGHLLRVDEGGSYELFEIVDADSVEETGLFGFVALQDGLLILPSAAGPPCSGETGVYYAEGGGTGLRVKAVDEPCEFRSEALEGSWSLTSSG